MTYLVRISTRIVIIQFILYKIFYDKVAHNLLSRLQLHVISSADDGWDIKLFSPQVFLYPNL
jgi:hypothetical protein